MKTFKSLINQYHHAVRRLLCVFTLASFSMALNAQEVDEATAMQRAQAFPKDISVNYALRGEKSQALQITHTYYANNTEQDGVDSYSLRIEGAYDVDPGIWAIEGFPTTMMFSGNFYNSSSQTISFTLGARYENRATGDVYYGEGLHFSCIEPKSGIYVLAVDLSNIPHGRYRVYPVFKVDGTDIWLDVPYDPEKQTHIPTFEWGDDLTYDFENNGLYFNILSLEDHTCEITRNNTKPDWYSRDIVIPSSVEYNGDTYFVTQIGQESFSCTLVTSVVIPEGVTTIKGKAFCGCGITDIKLPSTLKIIENSAFYSSNLESIFVPNNVEYMGEWCFANCENLKSVDIQANINSIPKYTFFCCKSLSKWGNIKLSPTIKTLNHESFQETSFDEIYLQESITGTSGTPFTDCLNLKKNSFFV